MLSRLVNNSSNSGIPGAGDRVVNSGIPGAGDRVVNCSCLSASSSVRVYPKEAKSNNNKVQLIHFGNNEYNHLIGRYIVHRPAGDPIQIKNIIHDPDKLYLKTDGHAGNAYRISFVEIKDEFSFRYFQEVVDQYGYLVPMLDSEWRFK